MTECDKTVVRALLNRAAELLAKAYSQCTDAKLAYDVEYAHCRAMAAARSERLQVDGE